MERTIEPMKEHCRAMSECTGADGVEIAARDVVDHVWWQDQTVKDHVRIDVYIDDDCNRHHPLPILSSLLLCLSAFLRTPY